MRRAALIGINGYPTAPLRGCLNDVIDWEQLLLEEGFDEVRLLVEANATKEAIISRAWWLRAGAQAGDELVFVMSSHGTRLDDEDALVPVNFDWDHLDTFITATELDAIFTGLAAGVKATIILDACHSGDMTCSRELAARAAASRGTPRFLAPPWGVRAAPQPKTFGSWLRVDEREEGLLLAACRSDQSASDSSFGEDFRPNGAFTYCLTRSLQLGDARTWLQVMEDARGLLEFGGFEQEPQLVAPARLINSYPWNGRMS